MKQKDLSKTFMTISNRKKPFSLQGFHKKFKALWVNIQPLHDLEDKGLSTTAWIEPSVLCFFIKIYLQLTDWLSVFKCSSMIDFSFVDRCYRIICQSNTDQEIIKLVYETYLPSHN